MTLRIERIPTLRDNYSYLLHCEASGEAAIVDAPEFEPIARRVKELGARVTHVLSTHHHPDHSAANPQLAKAYGAPVYGHASDAARLPGFTHGLEEGDELSVGRARARVLFIPAHTRGHIAYVFDEAQALFCGDTLFIGGCGRLFEGTPAMMFEAMQKLAALPDETRVFCGHEYTEGNLRFAAAAEPANEDIKAAQKAAQKKRAGAAADWHDARAEEMTIPGTIGEERKINPFLRAPTAEELGRLREWKDKF